LADKEKVIGGRCRARVGRAKRLSKTLKKSLREKSWEIEPRGKLRRLGLAF